MSRDYRLYLEDILACCENIVQYVGEMKIDQFMTDDKTYDAVVRNNLLQHRHFDPVLLRCLDRLIIAGVGMAHDAHPRIGSQDSLQPACGFGCAVCHDHMPGVLAEADPHPTAVVE